LSAIIHHVYGTLDRSESAVHTRTRKCAPLRFDKKKEEEKEKEDDDGIAGRLFVRASRESNTEKNPTAGYYLYGWSSVSGEVGMT